MTLRARPDRRAVLRGAGGTLALPFLESFGRGATPSSARPKRLVCVGVALSLYPGEWQPKSTGAGYELPRLLKPLADLRRDFTVISGCDHPGVSGGHKGTPAFLSGVYLPERVGQAIVVRNHVTLDQVAAAHLGGDTRFESLQFGAAPGAPDGALSWDRKGVPLLAQGDVDKVFWQLFVADANQAEAKRALAAGKSVLDGVAADAQALRRRVGADDAKRVDEYMAAVRDVEARLERQRRWQNAPKPKVPPLGERPTTYHDNLDLMFELAALALQTDSTRVISLDLPGSGLPITVGKKRVTNYHGQSHHGKDPAVVQELVEIEELHTKSLAKFLARLKSTPDGPSTLLERTQVLFGSGLGNGSSHSNRNLPVLLAGGGLRHGQHLRFPTGTPLCNVFVTMLQRLGVETDKFAGSSGNVNNEIG